MLRPFQQLRRALTQYAIRGAIKATASLPAGLQRSIPGRAVALAAYVPMLSRKVRTNMRLALGEDVPPRAERRYFQHLAWTYSNSLATFHRGIAGASIADQVKFDETIAVLDDAFAEGKGIVFTVPHWSGHELQSAVVGRRHPMVMLVRQAPTQERADRKAEWYRALDVETVLRPNQASTFKDAVAYLRVLKQGKLLGITPDLPTDPGQGVAVSLFGRPARIQGGAFALALAAGAPMIRFSGAWQPDFERGTYVRARPASPCHSRSRNCHSRLRTGVVRLVREKAARQSGELAVLAGQTLVAFLAHDASVDGSLI